MEILAPCSRASVIDLGMTQVVDGDLVNSFQNVLNLSR
jgi:hypothetical protein